MKLEEIEHNTGNKKQEKIFKNLKGKDLGNVNVDLRNTSRITNKFNFPICVTDLFTHFSHILTSYKQAI